MNYTCFSSHLKCDLFIIAESLTIDRSHFLAEQGETSATDQSSPGEKSYLVETTLSKLMIRCVARNPKEMVRQVAATKELEAAEVSFANDNSLSLSL